MIKHANWILGPICFLSGILLYGLEGGDKYSLDQYESEALHQTWQFKVVFTLFLLSSAGLLVKNWKKWCRSER